MSFLKAVEVTNAVFIILNSREGLKEHLKGVLFCDRGKWPFLSCRSPGQTQRRFYKWLLSLFSHFYKRLMSYLTISINGCQMLGENNLISQPSLATTTASIKI
jgi:hypothetical protein